MTNGAQKLFGELYEKIRAEVVAELLYGARQAQPRRTEPEAPKRNGRHRQIRHRTPGEMEAVQEQILRIAKSEGPIRMGDLCRLTGLGRVALVRPLSQLVWSGKVRKTGERLGARYSVAS